MSTAFDDVLVQQALRGAADAYALHHSPPGTPEYRAAWLKFRHRIRTLEDLQRWEARARRRERERLARTAATASDRARHSVTERKAVKRSGAQHARGPTHTTPEAAQPSRVAPASR